MGWRTFGKHLFAKTVRITRGVKNPQTNPHLLLKAPSLSSVIHIMDFSSSNCYFWLCICNYRRTFCCGNGFDFKGILEVWSCALAQPNFYTYINGECIFLVMVADWDVWGIRCWSKFRRRIFSLQKQIHMWTVRRMHTPVSHSFSVSHTNTQSHSHPHSYYIPLSQTNKHTHQTWAECTFCLGRDDKLLAAS